jgi:hypothetical protein
MGIAVETAERIGVSEFRFEDDGGVRGFNESALAGDAELGGEIGMYVCYGLKWCDFGHNKIFL